MVDLTFARYWRSLVPRKMKAWEERDAYTRWRRVLFWQRGELAMVKRRTHRRERREGKAVIREQIADD